MADIQNERNLLIQLQKYFEEKNYSAAFALAEKSLQQFPFSFQIKLFYIKILKALGRFTEARQFLTDLDKQFPYNISILMELASILFYLQEYQESLIYYNRILFLDSFNDQAKRKVEEIQRFMDSRFQERLDETQIDERNAMRSRAEMDIARKPTAVIPDEEIQVFEPEVRKKTMEAEVKALEFQSDISAGKKETVLPSVKVNEESGTEIGNRDDDIPFVTESAAELYLKQGLPDQARHIYRYLFDQTGDSKYIEKLNMINANPQENENERVIRILERFLDKLKSRENIHV